LLGVAVAACNFQLPFGGGVDASTGDTAADMPADSSDAADAPPGAFCAPDAQLVLCLSFDQAPLPAVLANEGNAAVSAKLTNVQQIASPDGNAALVDATSTIALPASADVTGVLSSEVWFRIDTDAANGARSGIYDSNISSQNISMFYNRSDPTHQLTCGLGNQATSFTVTVAIGAFSYAACTCAGTTVSLYLDGTLVAEATGDCATGGAFLGDGLTIGSNNTGVGQPVNDNLIGAIDGVRLWSRVLSASEIAARHLRAAR